MTHPDQPKDYAVEDEYYLTKSQRFLVLCVCIVVAGMCFVAGYVGAAKITAEGKVEESKQLSQHAAKEWMLMFGGPKR